MEIIKFTLCVGLFTILDSCLIYGIANLLVSSDESSHEFTFLTSLKFCSLASGFIVLFSFLCNIIRELIPSSWKVGFNNGYDLLVPILSFYVLSVICAKVFKEWEWEWEKSFTLGYINSYVIFFSFWYILNPIYVNVNVNVSVNVNPGQELSLITLLITPVMMASLFIILILSISFSCAHYIINKMFYCGVKSRFSKSTLNGIILNIGMVIILKIRTYYPSNGKIGNILIDLSTELIFLLSFILISLYSGIRNYNLNIRYSLLILIYSLCFVATGLTLFRELAPFSILSAGLPFTRNPIAKAELLVSTMIVVCFLFYYSLICSKLQKQQCLKEREHKLNEDLEQGPETIEDAMNQWKQLEVIIDYNLREQNIQKAIKFAEMRDQLYPRIIVLLKNLEMDTVIPAMENEKSMNQNLIYDLKVYQWVEKYNTLAKQIDINYRNNEYSSLNALIKEIIVLIEKRIVLAKKFNKGKDLRKFLHLGFEYTTFLVRNRLMVKINELTKRYQKVKNCIEAHKLTRAIKDSKKLLESFSELKEIINGKVSSAIPISDIKELIEAYISKLHQTKKQIADIIKFEFEGKNSGQIYIPHVKTEIKVPKIKMITQKAPYIKIPLNAKVILLGQSYVGKTHLSHTISGLDYKNKRERQLQKRFEEETGMSAILDDKPTPSYLKWKQETPALEEQSTIGINKYFKQVNIPVEGYHPQLCFWDLGGQWNFRAVNELFLNEASAILLLFDVSRKDSFEGLKYLFRMIKKTRSPALNCLFIVANKIDLNINSVSNSEIQEFLKNNQISNYYRVSAKEGRGIKKLLEDLTGAIDWSALIKLENSQKLTRIKKALKELRKHYKLMEMSELLNALRKQTQIKDKIYIKAALQHHMSQSLIQISPSELFVLLDPEFIKNWSDNLINQAKESDGIVFIEDLKVPKGISNTQLDDFLYYLERENNCYPIDKGRWVFPIVRKSDSPEIDEWFLKILDSDPHISAYRMDSLGDLIFSRITVFIAREYGAPESQGRFLSRTAGLWIKGHGLNKTILLLEFEPHPHGGMIRIKTGGGNGKKVHRKITELILHLFKSYSIDFEQL